MKKIYALTFLFILAGLPGFAQSANYVANGDFENDYLDWSYTAGNGSAIEFLIETENPLSGSKSAKLLITGKGTNTWDAQLDNKLTLHKGIPMKLSFKAKASAETFLNFETGQNYPNFLRLLDERNTVVGTEVITYEYTFTPEFSDGNMKLNFLLGNAEPGITLWIDDVVVEQAGSPWDGNIIPNGEFDEFSVPVDADNYPAYRKKKLSFSADAAANGGWEGGFAEGAPTEIIFDIDESGKLSGDNSAHIQVRNKGNENFFNGAFTVFFQATKGVEYELSFDVTASKDLTFVVAMNRHPFALEGQYEWQPDRLSLPVNATTSKETVVVKTAALTHSQMHQIFFAGLPSGGPYDIWIDNVKLKPYEKDQNDVPTPGYSGNPVIKTIFTADAAPLVHNNTLYLYTGHDEQLEGAEGFVMKDWHVFSTTNMVDWVDHGAKLSVQDFTWAKADAWASHVAEKDGKFYWYVPMDDKSEGWFSIGVAVSESPTGPFEDAIGKALITDKTPNSIELNIDPAVFVDDDGSAYLFWGGFQECRVVKLKSNMVELDGPVEVVTGLTGFTEGPFVHKKEGVYYMTYAAGYPEAINYATSDSPMGPWKYRGRLMDEASSETNHPSVVNYRDNWYFIYHTAGLPGGSSFRRSVSIENLLYNEDGTLQKIVPTVKGVKEMENPLTKAEEDYDDISHGFTIYPNPSNDGVIHLDMTGLELNRIYKVAIYSPGGRKLLGRNVKNTGVVTLITNFEKGLYLLKIQDHKKVITRKVVIGNQH